MLLKYSQAQKRTKLTGSGKPQRATGMMKLSSPSLVGVMPRIHRKVIKAATKRPVYTSSATTAASAIHHHGHHHHHHRTLSSTKREERVPVDPCDNSNDSGLGFDHFDYPLASQPTTLHFSDKEASWPEELSEVKRRRLEIKLESDDANDNFTFPDSVTHNPPRALCMPVSRINREKLSPPILPCTPPTLTSQLSSTSRDGRVQLQILCQPEQQHRARYQTEGSRGAVKDRTGNGFPVVKLVGYNKTTSLQVFIGTDQGKVAPHMFYQACRVSGKNSTPCTERKVDGTMVIEVDAEPSKDMIVTCDCVGILKERNVDVEHRFPEESSARSKKKSTRCRMVFRTTITHPNGSTETLQVTSQPIVCTQPPGVPEICKKSLTSCSAGGGVELFILGKNFLKDTRVVFQEAEGSSSPWKQTVQPDKEFLQQSHLVCIVPPYQCQDITEPMNVRLCVESSGKCSEPHMFLYTPNSAATPTPDAKSSATPVCTALPSDGHIVSPGISPDGNLVVGNIYPPPGITAAHSVSMPTQLIMPAEPVAATTTSNFITPPSETTRTEEKVQPMMLWQTSVPPMEKPMEMMPSDLLPIAVRRPSLQMIVPETIAPEELKQEVTDSPVVTIEGLPPLATIADLSSTQSPSMDTLRQFVSPDQNAPLPSLSLDNYLTNLENAATAETLKQQHQLIGGVPQILVPTVVTSAATPSGGTMFVENTSVLQNELMSHNATSRVVIETANPIQYTAATISSTVNCGQENLGVIVTSNSTAPEIQTLTLEQTQTPQIDDLVSSSMVRRTSTTDRLDAFVNSAAESHISPGANSSIMMPPPPPPDSVLQTIAAVQTSNISTSQSTNHQTLADTSLCSLLSTPLQDQSGTQVTPSLADLSLPHHLPSQTAVTNASQFEEQQQKFTSQEVISTRQETTVERKETEQFVMPMPQVSQDTVVVSGALPKQPQFELKQLTVQKIAQMMLKKNEEGIPLPHELTQMSENDLISYINPSCFDQDLSAFNEPGNKFLISVKK